MKFLVADNDDCSRVLSMSFGRQSETNIVYDNNCLFCGRTRRILKSKVRDVIHTCQTENVQHNIEEQAKLLKDNQMWDKISAIGDSIAKEIKYHHFCQEEYDYRSKCVIKQNSEKENSAWQIKKEICVRAFIAAVSLIETKIVFFGDVERMSDLLNQYLFALEGLGLSDNDIDLEKRRKCHRTKNFSSFWRQTQDFHSPTNWSR
jgi:hypothetical protein